MLKSKTITINTGTTQTVTYYSALQSIVANEVSISFSDEAIKAQIVATYTYLRYYQDAGKIPSATFATQTAINSQWGQSGTTHLQQLIEEVGGLLVTVDNHPAFTVYSAISDGYTNTPADVWGGTTDLYGSSFSKYMPSVASPWCKSVTNYETKPVIAASKVKSLLESYYKITLGSDKTKWIQVLTLNSAGYVMTVSIDGQATTTGRVVRENVLNLANLGSSQMLRSASFTVSYSAASDSFTFDVKGYGHGVGMSQNGANVMAKAGYTWQQIIKWYFPGVTVPNP